MQQRDKFPLLGPEAAGIRVHQHIPQFLVLGRTLFQHQMVLLQRLFRHGRSPHIGRGQPLQDGKLAAPLVNVDTAAVVELPVDAVAALAAGQLEIVVQHLNVFVQLGKIRDLPVGQRAVPVGQQVVAKIHDGLHFQPPPGAVGAVAVVVLHGIPQQCQVVAPAQHAVHGLHGTALPDVDAQLLHGGRLLQEIHRRIGGVGRVGQHHPQLGAALPLLFHAGIQPVHLLQHPGGLLNKMPPLLGGDHPCGRPLKNAEVVLFFQVLPGFAHVGLGGVQLLGRRTYRALFHNGHQVAQFGDVQFSLSFSAKYGFIVSACGRPCQAAVDAPAPPPYNR